jgi:hypothetical protein
MAPFFQAIWRCQIAVPAIPGARDSNVRKKSWQLLTDCDWLSDGRFIEIEPRRSGRYFVTSSRCERNHDWAQVRTERAGMIVRYDRCAKCGALRLKLPDLSDFTDDGGQHAEFDWLTHAANKH